MSSPVVVALDFETQAQALELVRQLGPESDHYKVGLQLLTEAGPELVRSPIRQGKHVLLDLKLHEIPNSVAAGVQAAGKLGASMVTVHASAGSAVLRVAVGAAAQFPNLKVLALTVITSLSDQDLPEIGLAPSVQQQVQRLALMAASAGCQGVVASVHEAAYLKSILPAGSLIVTPGIQLARSGATDQARISTPQAAAEAGVTHIVVGRAITSAKEPVSAFREAVESFHRDALYLPDKGF